MELRYRLIPYIYAQAALSSRGERHPMLRPVPRVPRGPDILIHREPVPHRHRRPRRPAHGRRVGPRRLPAPGSWIDYQGDKVYEGARWHSMRDGQLPVVMLVRDGAAIPHAGPAQSMGEIDWHSLELKVFCVRAEAAE